MRNCQTIQSWMVDYSDGSLTPERSAAVREHLTRCRACADAAHEDATVRQMLRALEPVQASPQFDSLLAARLARVQSAKGVSPRRAWAAWLSPPAATSLLRPALALGAATCMIAGALLLHPASAPVPAPAPVDDSALISQCVALHARDVAAQPLTDPASSGLPSGRSAWTGDATADDAAQDNL